MPYLILCTHGTACKNNLQKAISELVRKQDRKLLMTEIELTKFKDDLISHIHGLVKKYPKCTALRPYWWGDNLIHNDHKGDTRLSFHNGEGFVSCRVYWGEV